MVRREAWQVRSGEGMTWAGVCGGQGGGTGQQQVCWVARPESLSPKTHQWGRRVGSGFPSTLGLFNALQ